MSIIRPPRPLRRPVRRRGLRSVTAAAAALVTATGLAAVVAPTSAGAASAVGRLSAASSDSASSTSSTSSTSSASPATLTLPTGERVVVRTSQGRTSASFAPGSRQSGRQVRVASLGTHRFVLPRSASS